jgi:hypothetical protein
MTLNVAGVDPGPTTGIVTLHWATHPGWKLAEIHAYQCGAASAVKLLGLLLDEYGDSWAAGGIEKFVGGNLPDSPVTRRLVAELRAVAAERGLVLVARPAATVKPWASDRRLTAAGIWPTVPKKMLDARSAAQIALYSACADAGIPDPLSKKAKARDDGK